MSPRRLLACAALGALAAACGGDDAGDDGLVVAAYTAPREALERELIPAFREEWRAKTGEDLAVRVSYGGSGAQARAVIDGLEADVVLLAMEPDVDRIARAGLIREDWRQATGQEGIVARTRVTIAVRMGNPLGLGSFDQLAAPGVEILTPNPRTSGGAMWNLLAVWDSVGVVPGLLDRFLSNVVVMDKGARESIINFERGIGDAAVTYEQEVFAARAAGRDVEAMTPRGALLVEIPAAVVERYAGQHGRRSAAEAFVRFLGSWRAQGIFERHGFLRVDRDPGDVRRIRDLGGWGEAIKLFGKAGAIAQALEKARPL